MTSRSKRRRLILGLAVLVGLVVLIGAAYVGVGTVLFDGISRVDPTCGSVGTTARFSQVTPATLHYTEADFGPTDTVTSVILRMDLSPYRMPDFEDVSFPSRSTPRNPPVTLRAWWVPGPAADAPSVILVHGRGGCRKDWNVEIPAGMLHRAGYAVLLLDLRNQGDSTVTDGRYYGGVVEHLDVLGAWDWLTGARGIPAARIGLFGASLGAAAVMLAAANEPRVAAVWEDSGYADAQQRVAEELAHRSIWFPEWIAPSGGIAGSLVAGVDIYGQSPLGTIGRLAGRHLFIAHGLADAVTPVHHAQDLYEAGGRAGVFVELWIVPFAGHTWEVVVDPAAYERRLDSFFREYLSGTAGDRSIEVSRDLPGSGDVAQQFVTPGTWAAPR